MDLLYLLQVAPKFLGHKRLHWQRKRWEMIGVADCGHVAHLGEQLLCNKADKIT